MAPPRRSRRLEARSISTTPATTASPIFSSKTSLVSETPVTSDEDENNSMNKTKVARPSRLRETATRVTSRKKRELEDVEVTDQLPPASKKRNVSASKANVVVETASRPARNRKPLQPTVKSVLANKVASKLAEDLEAENGEDEDEDEDEERIISEDEIDFVENASLESDASSSGFELEDEDEIDDEDSDFVESKIPKKSPRKTNHVVVDSDVEDQMLNAALELSKITAALDQEESSSGAGPSTGLTRAKLRSAAAEAKLAEDKELGDNYELSGNASELSEASDEVPLAKVKGKGKGKAKTANKTKDKSKGKGRGRGKKKDQEMDNAKDSSAEQELNAYYERIARKREREAKLLRRRENKWEERQLSRKLGRKLTRSEKTTIALYKEHPELRDVWTDLESIEAVAPEKAEQPSEMKVTLLPFQLESLFWMRKQEQGVWHGGMLADEMGMGKTIQTLALLASDRQGPNLVVAPTVAIMQWRNEIEAYTDGLKIAVWHGSSRESKVNEIKKFDVVLTTYAVLESAFRKQESGFKRKGRIVTEKSPIHQIEWHRIILDEAHNIKERATNTAKAAFELNGRNKWCLSGTPLQNRVGELYSLVRFLGGDPFAYYFCKYCSCKSLHWKFSDKRTCDECGHTPMMHTCLWNNEILTPIQKYGLDGPGKTAFRKLRILLDRMMLRRTKVERADDLGLPPRTVIVRRDYFSPEEKELYLSLFSESKRQFSYYVDQGTLLNNYSNIFSLITRMRQMACHPDLVLRSKTNANAFSVESYGEATVCRLCNDIAEDAIQSKCKHIFDRECIKQYINTAVEQIPDCPVCHIPLTIDLEAPALEIDPEVAGNVRQGILGRLDINKWRSSSKIEALVEELTNLRKKDATTKSLVFSQFVNFLDLIAFRLQRAGFTICRLEGTMSPQARDMTIKHFMQNVHVTVFLVSLKAGGVALNLTEASRVYLMDSWWNPAVEFQAMDRIHRLGQHRPVQAIKLVIEDSIESRIIQLQEKKSAMINATLSTDESAMGRLTPADLSFLFRL